MPGADSRLQPVRFHNYGRTVCRGSTRNRCAIFFPAIDSGDCRERSFGIERSAAQTAARQLDDLTNGNNCFGNYRLLFDLVSAAIPAHAYYGNLYRLSPDRGSCNFVHAGYGPIDGVVKSRSRLLLTIPEESEAQSSVMARP